MAPFEEDLEEEARCVTIQNMKTAETRLKARVASLKSKGRYLVHLRDEATEADSHKLCIICQQHFEIGLLTTCGHSYCAQCFRWVYFNLIFLHPDALGFLQDLGEEEALGMVDLYGLVYCELSLRQVISW